MLHFTPLRLTSLPSQLFTSLYLTSLCCSLSGSSLVHPPSEISCLASRLPRAVPALAQTGISPPEPLPHTPKFLFFKHTHPHPTHPHPPQCHQDHEDEEGEEEEATTAAVVVALAAHGEEVGAAHGAEAAMVVEVVEVVAVEEVEEVEEAPVLGTSRTVPERTTVQHHQKTRQAPMKKLVPPAMSLIPTPAPRTTASSLPTTRRSPRTTAQSHTMCSLSPSH